MEKLVEVGQELGKKLPKGKSWGLSKAERIDLLQKSFVVLWRDN